MQSFFGSSIFESAVTHALLFGLLFAAAVKVTLLMALAGLCALALSRASASARHFVWRMAFTGVVVILAGTFLLPFLSVGSARITAPIASVPVWRTSDPMPRMAVQQTSARMSAASILPSEMRHVTGALIEANAPAPNLSAMTPGQAHLFASAGLLWLCGTLLVLLRLILRLRAVTVLQRHSHALTDARLLAIARNAAAQTGLSALPRLLTQNAKSGLFSPLTWGWRGACVLLPHDTRTWPDARVDAVLRHELAHVRRNDWIAQRGAEAVCALLWFHPLVWLAARQLRASAEQACDDAALTSGVRPALYAQHLLDIARLLRRAPALPPAALPFLSRLPLESRLRAVLDPRARRKQLPPRMSRFLFLLMALCLLPTALIVPTVSRTLAQQISAPVRALNNKVTLSNGISVELLGVTKVLPTGRLKPSSIWWHMDGTPLASPPYQSDNRVALFFDSKMLRKMSHSKSAYAIGLHISGIAEKGFPSQERYHAVLLHGSDRAKGILDSLEQELAGQEHGQPAQTHTLYVEASAETTRSTIRYGIANGPWTDAPAETIETGSDCAIRHDISKRDAWKWIPSSQKPYGRMQVPLVKTSDSLGLVARRVIAYTRSGKKAVYSGYCVDLPNGRSELRTFLPDNFKWSDVRKFQLQTRPYQWAEFPNIPLQPTQTGGVR